MSAKADPKESSQAAKKKTTPINEFGAPLLPSPISGKNIKKFIDKALLCACASGDVAAIDRILPLVDLDKSKALAAEAFCAAAATGHIDIARRFQAKLEKGKRTEKLLIAATAGGDLDLIREFLAAVPKDSPSAPQYMSVAANNGRPQALKLFTSHFDDAVLHKTEGSFRPPIFGAASSGDKDAVLDLLEFSDQDQINTALRLAADKGHADVIEALLPHISAEDDPATVKPVAPRIYTTGDKRAYTISRALEFAALGGHLDVVKILSKLTDPSSLSIAIHCAATGGHAAVISHLLQIRVPSSDPEENMKKLAAALNAAAANGGTEAAEILIPLCNKKDIAAALQTASQWGRTKVAKVLIQHTDPKANNSAALASAAMVGNLEMVQLLIPVSDPKADNSFALRVAARHGHAKVVELLIPVSDPVANKSAALFNAIGSGDKKTIELLLPVSGDQIELSEESKSRISMLATHRPNAGIDVLKMILPKIVGQKIDPAVMEVIIDKKDTENFKVLLPFTDLAALSDRLLVGSAYVRADQKASLIEFLASQLNSLGEPVPEKIATFLEQQAEKRASKGQTKVQSAATTKPKVA